MSRKHDKLTAHFFFILFLDRALQSIESSFLFCTAGSYSYLFYV